MRVDLLSTVFVSLALLAVSAGTVTLLPNAISAPPAHELPVIDLR